MLIKRLFIFMGLLSLLGNTDFPASLPAPPANLSTTSESSLLSMSTPEYVIIRPSEQATFSSETAAGVLNIHVKEGSTFNKGDILLELDCRLQKAELQKALAQQSATKMAAKAALKLKSYGSISEFELMKATSEADMANADVDKLSVILEKCTIKAPYNGSVAEVMVHAYESVKPGDPLLRIVNTDNLEFEIQVPSCWLQWIKVGSVFSVHINEINKNISAKVTKINPQIEPVSQSVRLIATITPSDNLLLPGMSGQAMFPDKPSTNCAQG